MQRAASHPASLAPFPPLPPQVSLMNAPLVRMSFSVTIHSDHVALTENVNRFKVGQGITPGVERARWAREGGGAVNARRTPL